MAQKAKVFIYANKCTGEPKLTDFELREEDLDTPVDGEFIAEAMFFGLNAGLRAYQDIYPIGSIIVGGQVARVVESKCSEFPGGAFIYGLFGWRSRTLVKPKDFSKTNLFILPDFHGHPLSLAVGFLGMPGNTAYFGMLEICKPKPGETVVISTAAGSVGLIAGQIAKLKGCKVVGFTGSEDKRQLLLDKYGFDKAINYKNGDMVKALKEAAPEGVDCYFDNVGGELSAIIINQMNQFGRIACSGAVSEYNLDEPIKLPSMQVQFIFKQLTMEGFVVYRWAERWMEAINQNLEWIKEGKIKYDETITEGFENMPQAFIDVMRGKNMGKAVLKV